MSVTISTKNFVKVKSIQIDGMDWEFVSPGAGLSLELSRLAREISENKDATTDEQTKMIETMFEYYGSIFRDKTKDNKQVKAWLRATPIDALPAIVADINRQFEEGVDKSE